MLKGGVDEVHVVEEGLVDFVDDRLPLLVGRELEWDFSIEKPFHVPVACASEDETFIDLEL